VADAHDRRRVRTSDGAAVHSLHIASNEFLHEGRSAHKYRAPLFIAWQLTNRCQAHCIACCEESGPDKAWRDELTADEAIELAQRVIDFCVPYVAFGGGEPLGVSHCWRLFELFSDAGVAIKLETDGQRIDDANADRLAQLAVQCVQISIDGATAATHELVRPSSSHAMAVAAIKRLVKRGQPPQLVFVPTRFNIHEMNAAYELALDLGCSAFVTGPLMRLGRAAHDWDRISCSDDEWQRAVDQLRERANSISARMALSIYPWDIVTEMERRIENPQAMLLIVPNGKVKLLNALPFSPADLRHDSLERAWQTYLDAWRSTEVREFVAGCRADPSRLRHANETWPIGATRQPLQRSPTVRVTPIR
jgi:MoaA/NifB/PqqE/SkfB family radical SAM enzyme